jgi:hypothetical protein
VQLFDQAVLPAGGLESRKTKSGDESPHSIAENPTMHALVLFLSVAAPGPKSDEPPLAMVTGNLGGRQVKYVDSLGTLGQGMAIALLGSSSVYLEGSEELWDAAIKKDHIRVRFARPHALRARSEDDQRTYEVSEIVIVLAGGIHIKARDKYHRFAKYDGVLWITFQKRFLGGD